jgi:hypothetical protein
MTYNLKPEITIKHFSDSWEGYKAILGQLQKKQHRDYEKSDSNRVLSRS